MWTLWLAQGVPLKDPEALIHYGRKFYFGDGQRNMNSTIEYVRKLAGGRLPPANLHKVLSDVAVECRKVRAKRDAAMPVDFASVQSERRGGVYGKIQQEAEKLLLSRGFYWRGAAKPEAGLDCRSGTYVHPTEGRSLSMRYMPQRNGVRELLVEVAPSWINNIVRKGYVDLAGPDTLTIGVERTSRGDKVTFYHKRPNGNQITLRQGYLSLRANARIVIDVTILKKITFKGVTDGEA